MAPRAARIELNINREELLFILPREQVSSMLRGYEPLNRYTVIPAIEQVIADFGVENFLFHGYAAVMKEALGDRLC